MGSEGGIQTGPRPWRATATMEAMARAHETQRADDEIEAREALMRQQFDRDVEAWEQALPAQEVLAKLEAKIKPTK